MFWGILLFIWHILAIEKGKDSLLSNNLYIKVPSLMVISKFKNLDNHRCSTFTNRSSKFATIIYRSKFINEVLCWGEMSSLDFVQNKLVMACILLHKDIKNIFPKLCLVNSHCDANFMFHCQISNIKIAVLYQMIYSYFKRCFTKTIKMPYGVDVLHKPASHPIFSYWVG